MSHEHITTAQLDEIRARKHDLIAIRRAVQEQAEKIAEHTKYRKQVLVCGGTGCTSSHSMKVIEQLEASLKENHIDDVIVVKTGCFGLCALGPIMIVYPEGAFYAQMTPEHAKTVVEQHLKKGGHIVKELLYQGTVHEDGSIIPFGETPFYKKQMRIALRNCGLIAAEDIEEAIAAGDYAALEKVLTSMTPDDVINEMLASGLRGRGGAGFPTGRKWAFAKASQGDIKYVCCNADEGDPGAFMDRSVLEGDPHCVLEAMTIAGYAIGAHQGYIYVRAEYPVAVQRLRIAIDQAHEYGLLGKNILGLGFDFDIEIRLGAGAFVCGEETALMNSVEGRRGEPDQKPPFPFESGLFHCPTIINNVETLANVPAILFHGADWFRGFGTEKIEDDIKALFPDARVARMDLDTTRTRTAYERIISDFQQGKTDILIGTQMVSKGLDFDHVSIVGILNADTMLNYPDFRAYERAFQLMAQVAGRAGRKNKRGRVVLQTKSIDHPIIPQVIANDYEAMVGGQLAERQMFHYPPYYRLVYVYLKNRNETLLDLMAQTMAAKLRTVFGNRVLGPDKPPVARVQTLFIRKIVLKIETNAPMARARELLVQVQKEMVAEDRFKSLIVYYDVDPM
mgnify:CR=1 FL=1